jgi:ketosteroid isomerase-like protein
MSTTKDRTPAALAAAYFQAWQDGDAETLRDVLAEDVHFEGPLATDEGRDDCVDGLLGMRRVLTRLEVKQRLADETDVITWFDLHTSVADPAPTANWSHVEDGHITRIRVAFDPRGILSR